MYGRTYVCMNFSSMHVSSTLRLKHKLGYNSGACNLQILFRWFSQTYNYHNGVFQKEKNKARLGFNLLRYGESNPGLHGESVM